MSIRILAAAPTPPAAGTRSRHGGRRRTRGRVPVATAAVALAACLATPAGAATTQLVSVPSAGGQSDGQSNGAALSTDGRFVAFQSNATNLVPHDTNDRVDIFVRDRRTGTTQRVSVGPAGAQANDSSSGPAISGGGRFVTFTTDATNLVPGDTNNQTDVFVRDLQAGTTTRVSVGAGGAEGDGHSFGGAISGGGRYVVFGSLASNLVPGDTNDQNDIFVRDLVAGTTRRVSVRSGGGQVSGFSTGPTISADGRFVAFTALAPDLVPGDTNGTFDVFVHELATGTTRRVSVGPRGVQGNRQSSGPAISADGRYVAFVSAAGNLVPGDTNRVTDVFVRDLVAGTTRRVSLPSGGGQSNGASNETPAISGNGRLVAFSSTATNLVPRDTNGDPDVFVRDLAEGTTRRASVRSGGGQSASPSSEPEISPDGRVVSFASRDRDLVPGDTNNQVDLFVRIP